MSSPHNENNNKLEEADDVELGLAVARLPPSPPSPPANAAVAASESAAAFTIPSATNDGNGPDPPAASDGTPVAAAGSAPPPAGLMAGLPDTASNYKKTVASSASLNTERPEIIPDDVGPVPFAGLLADELDEDSKIKRAALSSTERPETIPDDVGPVPYAGLLADELDEDGNIKATALSINHGREVGNTPLGYIHELSMPTPFEDEMMMKKKKLESLQQDGDVHSDEDSIREPPEIEGGNVEKVTINNIRAREYITTNHRGRDEESQAVDVRPVMEDNGDVLEEDDANPGDGSVRPDLERNSTYRVPKAYLVEEQSDGSSIELVFATQIEPTLPWWKDQRKRVLLCAVFLLVAALSIGLGVSLSRDSYCGNGLVDAGEACDGGANCNENCLVVADLAADLLERHRGLSLAPINPNGVWTYGRYELPYEFHPFTVLANAFNYNGVQAQASIKGWFKNPPTAPDPNIMINVGDENITSAIWGNILFESKKAVFGPYQGPTAARFTPPVSGYYQITYEFKTVQEVNAAPAATIIFDQNTKINFFVDSAGVSGEMCKALDKGNYVDFLVMQAGGTPKSTQVDVEIEQVLECPIARGLIDEMAIAQ